MRTNGLKTEELRRLTKNLPRVDLAHLPTPLEEVPRFAEAIGAARVFIKRDDCTGLAFGGNKTRHNEFLMADALKLGCDMVVWGAGIQSNNCRQTAAACAKLGLECRLFLSRGKHSDEIQGNLLLDHLMGAKVEIVEQTIGPDLDDLMAARAEKFRAAGRKPYVWDRDHVKPIAAISYAECMAEIVDDLAALGLTPDAVYVSSAGSTGAGMALGKGLLRLPCPVRSICPIRWPWDVREDMAKIASDAAALLTLPHRFKADDIDADESQVGPAYGVMTSACREAIRLLAHKEGILLDPSYTSKAMAGLIEDVRSGRIKPGSNVVFVHTGGLPAIFAYRDELLGGGHH